LPTRISAAVVLPSLPQPVRTYAGFGYRDVPGQAVGGFAMAYGDYILYGTTGGDDLTVLGLHNTFESSDGTDSGFGAALAAMMHTTDLVLVDWVRMDVVEPEMVAQYLALIS
jgi:hypothetical protein